MADCARQLLVFKFGGGSRFEGQLVGALERIEIGGSMRVLDGLFVARESESGELSAILLSDLPPSRVTSRLLDFRLADRARRAATQATIGGAAGDAVRRLAALLGPGAAIAALLIEHKPAAASVDVADALADAVARLGGTEIVNDRLHADRITELTSRVVAAAGSPAE
jgi:hypothetical protein